MESSARLSAVGGSDPEASSLPFSRPMESWSALVHGLRLLGMSSHEARMYLALLRGPVGARTAAEIAGLHRATGYRVLLRLLDRGLILGNGRTPRGFQAVAPSTLFQRLELFYRDEIDLAAFMVDAFSGRPEAAYGPSVSMAGPGEPPRILASESESNHPALAELAEARHALALLVRPLSTPLSYRMALARTLGQLARRGLHIRMITDATPADYRFYRAILKAAGSVPSMMQVRHYSPMAAHLYVIDRRRVVRLPTLGATSRAQPIAVSVADFGRVRAQVNRFEGLWTEATLPVRPASRRSAASIGAARNRPTRAAA